MDEPEIADVKIEKVEEKLNGELSKDFYYECAFCQKSVRVQNEFQGIYTTLSGTWFHCPFCIRQELNTKNSKHVLILSFRAILGYYYYGLYLNGHEAKIYVSEIKEILDSHEQTGLLNPVFSYDPETMLWFIDFNRVGHGKKKIAVEDVLKTISNILVCFNLQKYMPMAKPYTLYQKYDEAIRKWYADRSRPEGKRFLIPTLLGCGVMNPQGFTIDETKSFVFRDLIMRR